jgi:hypothetical protein
VIWQQAFENAVGEVNLCSGKTLSGKLGESFFEECVVDRRLLKEWDVAYQVQILAKNNTWHPVPVKLTSTLNLSRFYLNSGNTSYLQKLVLRVPLS